jgi:hypothetical protein
MAVQEKVVRSYPDSPHPELQVKVWSAVRDYPYTPYAFLDINGLCRNLLETLDPASPTEIFACLRYMAEHDDLFPDHRVDD